MDGFRRNGQHDERKTNYCLQVSFLMTCQQATTNGVRRSGKHDRRTKLVIKPLECVAKMRIPLPWQH
jgi:hypothetical protein